MNISHRISQVAKTFPDKKSVVFSLRQKDGKYSYPFYTFKEFEDRSNQMSNYFLRLGIKPGTRVLLFVKPCLDFSVITFALFKVGAVPILIDPGMGMKNLLSSVKQVRPEAMISIGKVHWVRRFLRSSFSNIKIKISLDQVGGRTHYLYEELSSESKEFSPFAAQASDTSAILFTSGGTGIPKGVIYTHGILNAQTDALREMFNLDEKQTDLPGFPLFALFTLAMGMTSVIPDMDPTHPADCDPKTIVRNILDQQTSFVAGSPSIWEKVGKYCLKHNIQLGSVKYVVMFGAPVRVEIHQMYKKILPFGDTFTPYGATECLPVSLISGSEILSGKAQKTLQGQGTCVGKAVPGISIKIIAPSDIPKSGFGEMPVGEVGEIIVSGTQVTPAYFEMDEETKKAKIIQEGKLWHRMGDMGWLDHEGNLWFLGRKVHQVIVNEKSIFYPLQVEAIFNQHPAVRRSALIKLKINERIAPGLVIERHDGQTECEESFVEELIELGKQTEASRQMARFFLYRSLPVDVRHNIKIDRVKLSSWAQNRGNQCLKKPNIM
jgi:acyl-CoA synthetase (AMP-forming)/AMP-acid ligase II